MTEHDRFESLAELYALGALDRSEKRDFEDHLASGCDICQASLNEAREVTEVLPMAMSPIEPPASVKERLVARVQEDRRQAARERAPVVPPPRASTGVGWAWKLLAAAGLIAPLGAGYYAMSLLRVVDQERLARRLSDEEASRLRSLVQTLTSPRNQAVTLEGQEAAPEARATAFVDNAGGRLLLYVENLPPLPDDQTYQIWVIAGGDPISVGLLDVAADGTANLESQSLPAVSGTVTVAITVEPAGGVPQPTGAMVLVGT